MSNRKHLGVLIMAMVMGIALFAFAVAQPTGTTNTLGPSSRGPNATINNVTAEAGNVTVLNVDQNRITGIWQGYQGNVTGQIVLENAAGNNFYDWDFGTVSGEILATRDYVYDWTGLDCSNSTSLAAEETTLNIESTDADGINETYNETSHPGFTVASIALASCPSTRPYNASGLPGEFWNVALNSNSSNIVYTVLLSDDSSAYDGGTADFEIMVPVDEDTGTSVYYLYAELS